MLSKKYTTISFNNKNFTIHKNAYEDFTRENNLSTKIFHLLGTIDYSQKSSIEKASTNSKKLIMDSPMSKALIEEIIHAYELLGGFMKHARVTVQLMPKQKQTDNTVVHGEATLLVNIKEAWASFFEPHLLGPNALHNKNGEILVQTLDKEDTQKEETLSPISQSIPTSPSPLTATKVYVNLAEPDLAEDIAKRHVDGIGLLRAEFMMAEIGTHPKKMIEEGRRHEYVEKLAEGMGKFAKAFSPRPVVYRTSDFKTNEYRHLKGGEAFEPQEANPMLGFRGAFRYLHDPELFDMELDAIKHVREKMGYKNLWIMLPFVRTVDDLVEVKKLITKAGLYRSPTFKIWMTIEIPSNVILLEKFIEVGIDGVSIGSNDLTMLILGVDRDNTEVEKEFNEENEAVLWAIEKVVKTARKYHITASLCGQAASTYPKLVENLVRWGVTSVSVSPDAITSTREAIAQIEKEVLK